MNWLREVWIFGRFLTAWLWTLVFSLAVCLLALFVGPTRAWVWCHVFWARVTLALVGVQVSVTGAQNLEHAGVFISNHQSLIDVVILPAILPPTTRFVGKKELQWIPLWGWMYGAGGALLIDRKNTRRARQSLQDGIRRLPRGWSLVVFPEGTRSMDGTMGPFKSGAFHLALQAKLPVIPVGLDGARDIIAPQGWLVRGGEVRVHIGPPIDSSAWRQDTLRQNVREGRAAVAESVACAQRLAAPNASRLSRAQKPA